MIDFNTQYREIDITTAPLADQILAVADDPRLAPSERLNRLDLLADFGSRVVANADPLRPTSTRNNAHVLAATIACAPSLRAIATYSRQTSEVATEVADNMRETAASILEAEAAIFSSPVKGLSSGDGAVDEVAVLAVMAWGIANDPSKEGDYVIPASGDQDASRRESRSDHKSGADIAYYYPHKTDPSLVQVKRKAPNIDNVRFGLHKNKVRYIDDVPVIAPSMLINADRSVAGLLLLDAIVKDDAPTLQYANWVIDDALHTAS